MHPLTPFAIFVMLFWGVAQAFAQTDHHVRAGATGANDGTDWTDAWTDLPATLTRGDTYYIADGTYGSYRFNDAESGTTLITIKKATEAEHGSATGWNSAYGDGQALWDTPTLQGADKYWNWVFDTGYYHMDGVTGGGETGDWDSGHGFKIADANAASKGADDQVKGIMIVWKYGTDPDPVTDVTLEHIEFSHVILPAGGSNFIDATGDSGGDGHKRDITVRNCWTHTQSGGSVSVRTNGSVNDNWLLEYNFFDGVSSAESSHGIVVRFDSTQNVTFRYNRVADFTGTGAFRHYTTSAGNPLNTQVYGNVFWHRSGYDEAARNTTGGGNAQGVSVNSTQNDGTGWRIYNNTFVNLSSPNIIMLQGNGTDNICRNNLAYNLDGTMNISGPNTISDNEEVVSNPFTDWTNDDFTLTGATTDGFDLLSPFDEDPTGATRGASGTWDLGAYEFGTAAPGPTTVRLPAGGKRSVLTQ